ncbi:MAG: glycine cleavage system aminomethyltransferase GcvT [Candidatus Wallbacteria bacterium]|nr:glycine cleavage system aminomethyltransferase GcvT [Candidatus Wallbacteria bacterium]
MKKTPLYEEMVKAKGRMVEFAGFMMPVQFSGIINEHMTVRKNVGLFDVSHMGEITVTGSDALKFVDFLVTNKVRSISDNQVLYSPMCHEHGGIVDDLLVYRFNSEKFLLVVNASNIDKDFKHIQTISKKFKVTVKNDSDNYAQIAVQGPKAIFVVAKLTEIDLDSISFYWFRETKISGFDCIVSRTGYTGEDGFEIYCSPKAAPSIWQNLMKAGTKYEIQPCGLGSRDTLRFENKLVLYGHELDDQTTPLNARLNWAIDWDSDFNGKNALLKEKEEGLRKKLVGLEMLTAGVPRQGYKVFDKDQEVGVVTSGCKAPFLDKFLALAYLKPELGEIDSRLFVEIHGKKLEAKVVKTPFYKKPALTKLAVQEKQAEA